VSNPAYDYSPYIILRSMAVIPGSYQEGEVR
jgi:hypothetical protein